MAASHVANLSIDALLRVLLELDAKQVAAASVQHATAGDEHKARAVVVSELANTALRHAVGIPRSNVKRHDATMYKVVGDTEDEQVHTVTQHDFTACQWCDRSPCIHCLSCTCFDFAVKPTHVCAHTAAVYRLLCPPCPPTPNNNGHGSNAKRKRRKNARASSHNDDDDEDDDDDDGGGDGDDTNGGDGGDGGGGSRNSSNDTDSTKHQSADNGVTSSAANTQPADSSGSCDNDDSGTTSGTQGHEDAQPSSEGHSTDVRGSENSAAEDVHGKDGTATTAGQSNNASTPGLLDESSHASTQASPALQAHNAHPQAQQDHRGVVPPPLPVHSARASGLGDEPPTKRPHRLPPPPPPSS